MKDKKFKNLEKSIKEDKVDLVYLSELIEAYPNDMELGKILREYYLKKKKNKSI